MASDLVLHCLPMSHKINTTIGLNGLITTKNEKHSGRVPDSRQRGGYNKPSQRHCVVPLSKLLLFSTGSTQKTTQHDSKIVDCDVNINPSKQIKQSP